MFQIYKECTRLCISYDQNCFEKCDQDRERGIANCPCHENCPGKPSTLYEYLIEAKMYQIGPNAYEI